MIKRRADLPGQIYAIFDEEWREKNGYDLEVAYWRKCWNVRAIIFDVLNIYENNDYQCPMDVDDVSNVIHALSKLNKKNYLDDGGTIWDWKDFNRNNRRCIKRLEQLRRLMRKCDKIEVYFYDSW